MKPITISESEYLDKVAGCWLGKNIGGTLGAPYEGRKELLSLGFYDPLPDESAANDDLDLQLVWLAMLEERGVRPTLNDFAEAWQAHLAPYPWNEYGFCQRNLARGLRPPISGCFENYFVDEMGSPIRSEVWACVAPGDPQLAAVMAWKDAVLDHAGGEGVYGEMFWAAVESAAFVVSDPVILIEIGLEMIPIHSQINRVIRDVVWCWRNGVSWQEARERVLTWFGHSSPCHATQNHGFTVLGWLYGKDYGDQLCTAVNCGYDTDCTGATLGSVLGILRGASGTPKEWHDPIGDRIVLCPYTQLPTAPKTIGELTERTAAVARQVLSDRSDVSGFSQQTKLGDNALSLLSHNALARQMWQRDVHAATLPAGNEIEITLHYHGAPVIKPGIAKNLSVSLQRDEQLVEAKVELESPRDWTVKRTDDGFLVCASDPSGTNTLTARARVDGRGYAAEFVILGPGEAQGFPCGQNVATCPRCHARAEACICGSAPA